MLNCKWFLDKGKEKAKGDIYVLEKRKEGKKKKRDKHGNLLIWNGKNRKEASNFESLSGA